MKRSVNEDRYALVPDLGLYLVADGMGGHTAGQIASQLAAEASLRAIETLEGGNVSLTEKLRHAVACANREIYRQAKAHRELAGMGTTLVAILAGQGRAALAHVGDSRAYLIRGQRIRQLTEDHSVVGELLRRRKISQEAARAHPHRHVLTRALGVKQSVEPDLAEFLPAAGDIFAMCSDGLTGHLRDHEIAETICTGSDLQESCEALVRTANERGGLDNTTVVLVRFEEGADAESLG